MCAFCSEEKIPKESHNCRNPEKIGKTGQQIGVTLISKLTWGLLGKSVTSLFHNSNNNIPSIATIYLVLLMKRYSYAQYYYMLLRFGLFVKSHRNSLQTFIN